MNCHRLAPVVAVFALLSTATADALSGACPRHACYRGWHYDSWSDDGWGWGGYSLNQDAIATRYVVGANQVAGSVIAARQSAAMQGGIRNAMSLDAWQRGQNIYAAQQGDRDWFMQTQLQQASQRQLLAARYAGTLMPAAVRATTTDPTPPEPALDVFRWPFVLQAPQFAVERASIESPYRRTAKDGKQMTAKDCLAMLAAVERMRTTLKEVAARVTADEYFDARAFLDRLAKEAQSQVVKVEKAEKAREKKE